MALSALDRIDDAVDLTRSFLLPFDRGRWARLALVTFLLLGGSGGASVFSLSGNVPTGAASTSGVIGPGTGVEVPSISGAAIAIVLAAVALVVLVGLVVAALGAIAEFVFVESLARDEIHVRAYARRYAGKGLRLFAFRFVLGALTLLVLGGAALALFGDVAAGLLAGEVVVPSAPRLVAGVLALGLLGLVVGLVVGLLNGFTTEFVVPIMLREDRGLIAAWKRFWPTLTAQWRQYGAYVLVALGLHVVTEIAGATVLGILAATLGIPFLVVAFPVGLGAIQGGTLTVAAVAILLVVGLAYLLVVFAAAAVVYVPIRVFHRQFALLVLGDTNPEFDVLADRRQAG